MLVSYSKNYVPTQGKQGEMRLLGIYPTLKEAEFIMSKVSNGNILKIEETENSPTSYTVGEFIRWRKNEIYKR